MKAAGREFHGEATDLMCCGDLELLCPLFSVTTGDLMEQGQC